jgi:hypothetical protein
MLCAFGGRRDPPGHARCFSPGRWPAVIPGVRVIRPCGLLWMMGWPPCQRHLRLRARGWPRLTSWSQHPILAVKHLGIAPLLYRSTAPSLSAGTVASLVRWPLFRCSRCPVVPALPVVPQTGRCCTATTRRSKETALGSPEIPRLFLFVLLFVAERDVMPRAASRSRVV